MGLLGSTRVDINVSECCADIRMAHQDPDRLDRYAGLPEIRRECPPEPVRVHVFDTGSLPDRLKDQLNGT